MCRQSKVNYKYKQKPKAMLCAVFTTLLSNLPTHKHTKHGALVGEPYTGAAWPMRRTWCAQ